MQLWLSPKVDPNEGQNFQKKNALHFSSDHRKLSQKQDQRSRASISQRKIMILEGIKYSYKRGDGQYKKSPQIANRHVRIISL